jgi:hypothetical protein
MSHVRFTENETGLPVEVETVFCWDSEEARQSIVTYPSVEGQPGRRFALSQEQLNRHFTIVSPQEIFIHGYGHTDRPTKKQQHADKLARLASMAAELGVAELGIVASP